MVLAGLAASVPARRARAVQLGTPGPADVKVLRVAFNLAESSFDPAEIGDDTSLTLCGHVFEGLYGYDYLARKPTLRPVTAASMPEVSADFRVWTVRLRPGIFFADDPAFKGRARELVAADYVYSIKRFADPASRSPMWSSLERAGFRGLAALRNAAIARRTAFDYDKPIEGLQAIDRYTIRFVVEQPRPRLSELLIVSTAPAMAREVVESYGRAINEHPVGTGPFRLVEWRRSSRVVLVRNPNYRRVYEGVPDADDDEAMSLMARFGGRPIPFVDRVEASIVEEDQPRWLTFLNGEFDRIEVPKPYLVQAVPNGQLAPYLAHRGIRAHGQVSQTSSYLFFNMSDPVVGGYAPEKVALRRAIALGIDTGLYIRLVQGGQAIVAQSPIAPNVSGYNPAFRSEMGEYDPVRARALLDAFGYLDRDGDGWREHLDGQRFVLELAITPDARSRQFSELMVRNMRALGLRVQMRTGQWQELSKAARAGKLMMWSLGYGSTTPDGLSDLGRLYGDTAGSFNLSGFQLAAFDALYDRLSGLQDGPEREALFAEAKRLAVVYMPEKTLVHRVQWDLSQPRLVGYRIQLFRPDWYQMVDIDLRDRREG